jgi:hypothetical protein
MLHQGREVHDDIDWRAHGAFPADRACGGLPRVTRRTPLLLQWVVIHETFLVCVALAIALAATHVCLVPLDSSIVLQI